MNPRQTYLLQGAVQEYIRTARPVSSHGLRRRLKLTVSSATIRSALQELETAGFLYQPHTSAGRIPTDQGYRHYVDQADIAATEQAYAPVRDRFEAMQHEYRQATRAAAKLLAQLASTVAVTGVVASGEVQEAGVPALLEATAENHAAVREIGLILQHIDQYLPRLTAALPTGTHVYIGRENPLYASEHTSLVVAIRHDDSHGPVALVLIGPKRMEYRRNLFFVSALADILNMHTL